MIAFVEARVENKVKKRKKNHNETINNLSTYSLSIC